MITRLQVDGFKNLVDVDIHFDKFNVITGANGVGKSNLFDAIHLINSISKNSILKGLSSIRGGENNPINLFPKFTTQSKIEASFIVKLKIEDHTSFAYSFVLAVNKSQNSPTSITLKNEKLAKLLSDKSANTVFTDKTTGDLFFEEKDFLETINSFSNYKTSSLFNLGINDDSESKYARMCLIEIFSWATIYLDEKNRVTYQKGSIDNSEELIIRIPIWIKEIINFKKDENSVYINLSNRIFELTGDIKEFRLHQNEQEETLWLEAKDINGDWYPGNMLSDGTLRFLALIVLEMRPNQNGVFCIEEPENGIHPSKIPALMRLLRDISEKPGCQVIINTHSPALVAQTPAEDIIVAYPVQRAEPDGTYYTIPRFAGLKDTWRQEAGMHVATISQVMDYLDPVPQRYADDPKRLLDRDDARRLMERRQARTWEVTKD